MNEATFKQLKAQLEADFEVLRKRLGNVEDRAVKTAKDMKYARERQQHFGGDLEHFDFLFLQPKHLNNTLPKHNVRRTAFGG